MRNRGTGTKHEAVISVGSNIDPEVNVARVKERIRKSHRVAAESHFIFTKPIGNTDQPDFLNGVIRIQTRMDREQLKRWLRNAEKLLDRARTADKYGPRTMDLDIVVWDGKVVDPDVASRDFLRAGICEVWPDLDIKKRN